jgi:uncharacterized protein
MSFDAYQETSVTGQWQSLDPRARIAWTIGGAVTWVILGAIGIVIELSTRHTVPLFGMNVPWIGFTATVLLLILTVIWSQLAFTRFRFLLSDRELTVESGVLWRTRRCIPRSRVQHVDIQSGPIDRAIGLVDVHLYVAGGMGPVAQLPGVAPAVAEQLKTALVVDAPEGSFDGV